MQGLSGRQRQILDFIREFIEEHGYPPTIRDIQRGCDISSTSVVDYNLNVLRKRGLLDRDDRISRGIGLAGPARSFGASTASTRQKNKPETVAVPLVGSIAAGAPFPLPATESWKGYEALDIVDLPQAIVGTGERLYALRVRGDSMIDSLIADGDLVVMEQADDVPNGATAAVRISPDDETTLKKVYREGRTIRLQPANPLMEPIFVPAERVQILSRLVAVWRYLG
ncbi:MAG: repressor LexA [Chloroflexi bacterium]|nr:repressor LexA [Chloroflexota bacterium]